MSYAVTGTFVVTWNAVPMPVPSSSVAVVAVGEGQERLTELSSTKSAFGSLER